MTFVINKKDLVKKNIVRCHFKVTDEISGSGSVNQRYGSTDLDPYQNVTDKQHCLCIIKEIDALFDII
jgi:hypothetical protein